MKIEQLMTSDVATVAPDTPLKDVAALLSARHISGVPVVDDEGAVLGVVSEADILRKERGLDPGAGGRMRWLFRRLDVELDKLAARTAGEAMTSPALTLHPVDDVSLAAGLMVEHGINRLPIVMRGRLVGIVTRADLVRAFSRDDVTLEREIRDDIERRLWIDPDVLGLQVVDGVVSIRGTVDSDADAESIVSHIRRVPGVLDIRSELRF